MPKKSYNTLLDEHLHILIAQGNHEAFEKLKKRYFLHAAQLSRETLKQFEKTGITIDDLLIVCDNSFREIVEKYDMQLSSFYSFWKITTNHQIVQYLLNNALLAQTNTLKGSLSIDQEFDNNHSFADLLCEIDDRKLRRKRITEIKRIITQHSLRFTRQESAMLNLVLDGYSIADLEHTGIMSRSSLYLTFNIAIDKLQKILNIVRNKR